MDEEKIKSVRKKYIALKPFLNERTKRLWAAVEEKQSRLGMVENLSFLLQQACLEQQCIEV